MSHPDCLIFGWDFVFWPSRPDSSLVESGRDFPLTPKKLALPGECHKRRALGNARLTSGDAICILTVGGRQSSARSYHFFGNDKLDYCASGAMLPYDLLA